MFINIETGHKVRLTSQDGDRQVTYEPWDGGKSHEVTDREFFAAHREATPEEIEKHEAEKDKKPAAKTDDKKDDAKTA